MPLHPPNESIGLDAALATVDPIPPSKPFAQNTKFRFQRL
jgi:hypothetical protein